jgi:predicted DNA-binding transcriptional regulator AlpA
MDYMDTLCNTDLPALFESLREALTVPQFAKMLSLSRNHVNDLVNQGSLPSYHIASSVRQDSKNR